MIKRLIPSFILVTLYYFNGIANAQIINKTSENINKIKTDSSSSLIEIQKEVYPYRFPIWGQKVYDRGYSLPLPIGFSAGYVNSSMGMHITDLDVGFKPVNEFQQDENGQPILDKDGNPKKAPYFGKNLPQETVDNIVKGPILDQLKNDVTLATATGMNYRMDMYILPFMNVYGMVSDVKCTTAIGLGDISTETFDALAFGGGVTMAYGFKGWFGTVDVNYSTTETDLLESNVIVSTYSVRVGKRIPLNHGKQSIAFYVGAMNRNFVSDEPSPGYIHLSSVLPGDKIPDEIPLGPINDGIENKIAELYDGLPMPIKRKIEKELGRVPDGSQLNNFLNETVSKEFKDRINNTAVEYSIKKELIQAWTVQCGFSLEINKHFAIRGEYGIADNNKFLMTGINYRFGIKK
ncbi:hypothetical protein [Flammeovirga sp. SubArs3]|uniref:hypothetical protein n=1 Tax=Flammeovirga sp. SubArs3 TaxID=2995316 RepID=UPI00248B47C2|nr:hypothetical protein [Flammeovirga sp. SubArs3]